jgi:hypothetical protein
MADAKTLVERLRERVRDMRACGFVDRVKLVEEAIDHIERLERELRVATKQLPDGWRKCEFCGCITNMKLRVCCSHGRNADVLAGLKDEL